ncbi:hypothetical protein AB6A40_010717 [Gnathostoma spinigerum]|uniref:Uncharacterized protein n=1 Tax=Gnathostoma spinigerum TaxID=75299 RepID=A0ABD6EVP3_9BILA
MVSQANLVSTDSATVYCKITPTEHALYKILHSHEAYIKKVTGTVVLLSDVPATKTVTATSESVVKGANVELKLVLESDSSPSVMLRYGNQTHRLLLAVKDKKLTYSDMIYEVRSIFNIWKHPKVLLTFDSTKHVHYNMNIQELSGKTIEVSV